MKAIPLLTVSRVAAALYAIVVVVLTLLPANQLRAWAPFATQGAMDSTVGTVVAVAALLGGFLLLAAVVLAVAFAPWRPRIGPSGPRLSWPLVLTLIAYVAGLAMLASSDLRAVVREVAFEEIPGWLELTAERLRMAAGHALAYTGLGLLLALGWGRQVGLWRLGLLALALSAVIEALQGLVPGRGPSAWDVLANGLGLAGGLTAGGLLIGSPRWPAAFPRRRRRRRERRAVPRRAGEPRSV